MKRNLSNISYLLIAFMLACSGLAAKEPSQKTQGMDLECTEYAYRMGVEAMNCERWQEAYNQFYLLSQNYPETPLGQEANFFLGVAYYHLEEYDFANDVLNDYLKAQTNPRFFLEAFEYKFAIAEQFKNGACRRCFGLKSLPKWTSGVSLALEIYDEIAVALPHHDIAACSLFSKAELLRSQRDFRGAVESYQAVIKRFPKDELASESYLLINDLYLEQSRIESQNPDILEFAEINLRKFKRDFPGEERICQAERDVLAIKEVSAKGLYEMGDYYQRTYRDDAAILYYQKVMVEFPETVRADWAMRRLTCLCPEAIARIEEQKSHRESEKESLDDTEDFDMIDFD